MVTVFVRKIIILLCDEVCRGMQIRDVLFRSVCCMYDFIQRSDV